MPPVSVSSGTVTILKGGFNEESRKVPIWKFIELVAGFHDSRDHHENGVKELYSEEFSFKDPHGEHHPSDSGHDDSGAFRRGTEKIYTGPLGENRHQVDTMVALEKPDGYDVWSHVTMFADVRGKRTEGETTVTDENGREWEVALPTFYILECAKDDSDVGFKVKHIVMIKDTGVVNDKLDLRGVGEKRSTSAA